VTSSRLSRRLKHLVELEIVDRKVTDSWPPSTIYALRKGDARDESLAQSERVSMESGEKEGEVWAVFLKAILMFFLCLPAFLLAWFFVFIPPILAGVYAGLVTRSYTSAFKLCLFVSLMSVVVRGFIGFLVVAPALVADEMYMFWQLGVSQFHESMTLVLVILPSSLLGAFLTNAIRELHGDTLNRFLGRVQ